MRGLRTMLKQLLMGLAALFVAVPVCWLLLPDEALHEGAAALIDAPRPAPARDNAFLMVLGMRVAEARDPIDAGSQITVQHEQRVAAGEVFDQNDLETLLGPDALPSSLTAGASLQKLCDRERGPCLSIYQAAAPAIDGALDELAPWLARYRAMTSLPRYAETLSLTLESPFPDYGVLVRLAELADISVARRIASTDTRAAALDDFARDIGHWRRASIAMSARNSPTLASTICQICCRDCGDTSSSGRRRRSTWPTRDSMTSSGVRYPSIALRVVRQATQGIRHAGIELYYQDCSTTRLGVCSTASPTLISAATHVASSICKPTAACSTCSACSQRLSNPARASTA